MTDTQSEIVAERRGELGLITLNRPRSVNALTLPMIRALSACLLSWRDDNTVGAVAIRGSSKSGPFGNFCAGGDIRYFHQCLLVDDPDVGAFFTEEYALDHLIHTYPKPYVAFMDGVVMGGGMGISQGASLRLVTENTKMAMPETTIGLFPDVGAGYFLSRCPGYAGEWLALTGQVLGAADAMEAGLADHCLDAARLQSAWDALSHVKPLDAAQLSKWVAAFSTVPRAQPSEAWERLDDYFCRDSVADIVAALEDDAGKWERQTAGALRRRSPLMLHVALEQIRRGRQLTLAEDLRMERDMMQHCFFPHHLQRSGPQTDAAQGIRALAIDKDNNPVWNPSRIDEVTLAMVEPFFGSPWTPQDHPLRSLQ